MIVLVNKQDLEDKDTIFSAKDVGMWCIVLDGMFCGRFGTREDALSVYREVWFNHNS